MATSMFRWGWLPMPVHSVQLPRQHVSIDGERNADHVNKEWLSKYTLCINKHAKSKVIN
jgi:hypothetical protein